MVQTISPVLKRNLNHVQLGGINYDDVTMDFDFANDEGMIIHAIDYWVQLTFPFNTAEALYACIVSLNPTFVAPDPGAALALNDGIDQDTLWAPRTTNDLITSGAVGANNGIAYWTKDFSTMPQGGILTAQDLTASFLSNNTGGNHGVAIWYSIVSLTDRELVGLIARRRN